MREQHPTRANPESEQVVDQTLGVSLDVRFHGSYTRGLGSPSRADSRQIVRKLHVSPHLRDVHIDLPLR